jgi:hypothetical protein
MSEESDINLKLSLWRHWTWADRMRELFVHYLRLDYPNLSDKDYSHPGFFVSSMVTAMVLWYGLLYATCQGIEDSGKFNITQIAPAYPKVRERLRRFRNAAFHVHPKWWSPKLMDVLREPEDATDIRCVHDAVGAWLRNEFEQYDERDGGAESNRSTRRAEKTRARER